MKVSTKSRYGLRIVIRLAEPDFYKKAVPLWKLAEIEGISKKYMEHIAAMLERAGILRGCRGPKGGYCLAKSPKEITAREIVDAVEGTSLVSCVDDPSSCEKSEDCKARPFWEGLQAHIRDYMDSITVKDLQEAKL